MCRSAQARAGTQDRSGPLEPHLRNDSPHPQMPASTRGPQRRLARQLREAALRATPDELDDLYRLDRLVRCEALGVFEAQELVRGVIRCQHLRDAA
jgi:hypothetical protein